MSFGSLKNENTLDGSSRIRRISYMEHPELKAEVQRRRTFAIISHPDAGKTTLTEKLLL